MKTTSVKTGDIYPTNKGGPCKVLEYINYKKVLIGKSKQIKIDLKER